MWEIFKSNARKERDIIESERVKQEGIDKTLEEERVYSIYELESKRLNDKLDEERSKYNEKEKINFEKSNGTCPKCSSTKVVDKISQLKGEINGSSSISGSLGGMFGSGSIHGSIDTLEINKCTECSNEWKKVPYNSNGAQSWENKIRYLRLSINNLVEKPDGKEPYYINCARDFWSGTKLDTLLLLIKNEHIGTGVWSDSYLKEIMIELIKGKEDILINKLGFIK